MEKWQDPEILALWFGLILLFIIVLVTTILLLIRMNYRKVLEQRELANEIQIQHQQDLLITTIHAQEKERKRIASDLHDELIGNLTVIRIQHQMEHPQSHLDSKMEESIQSARRISHDLSPPMIEYSSVDEILLNLIDPWKNKFSVDYIPHIFDQKQRSDEFKTQIVRIFQEVITNINKHAQASHVYISLRKTKHSLFLSIYDNGKGMKTTSKKGLGLSNLESRTQYLNGEMKIKSEEGKRTGFLFLFPGRDQT